MGLGSNHFSRTPPLFDSTSLMLHPAMMALGSSLTPFSATATGSYELLQVYYSKLEKGNKTVVISIANRTN